jgi:hypothetical protein
MEYQRYSDCSYFDIATEQLSGIAVDLFKDSPFKIYKEKYY